MKTQVISFRCVIKNRLNQVLSSSVQRDVLNGLEIPGKLPDLVLGLQNVSPGERRRIEIKAERAYGLYDPDLYGEINRSELRNGRFLRLGETLQLYSPERKSSMTFRIVGEDSETIFVDANHPFAGQDLVFEIEILEARDEQDDDDTDSAMSGGYH